MSASHPQSGASPCLTDRPAVGVVCISYGVVSDDVVVPVAPSSRLVVVARVVAVLVVVAAFAHWLTGPVERSLGDLLRGLESGEVTRIVLGVPAEEGMIGGFAQRVEWEGPGRDGYATYEVSTLPGEMKDEDALIVQAVPDSPASVVVERRDEYWFGPTGMRWNPLGIVPCDAPGPHRRSPAAVGDQAGVVLTILPSACVGGVPAAGAGPGVAANPVLPT